MSTRTSNVRLRLLWMRVGVLMLGVSVCCAGRASAQTPRAAGPFAGLFGGGRTANSNTLDFRSSLFGVWQDVSIPDDVDPALLDPTLHQDSAFSGANASLLYAYGRTTSGTQFSVNGMGNISEYSLTWDEPQYNFNSSASLSTSLTRRISFNSSAAVGYSPYLSLAPVTGGGDFGSSAPNIALATAHAPNFNTTASVGLAYQHSRRGSFSVDLGWNETLFVEDSSLNIASWTSRAAYHYKITQRVSAHAGYFYGRTGFGADGSNDTKVQGFDFGIDYGDALRVQLARRTYFTFSPALSAAASGVDGQVHYAATGTAALQHSFGRTWSSMIQYSRSLGFVPGFQDLVTTDSASANLTGMLTRRISSTSGIAWSLGEIGFSSETPNATSYTAYSGISFGLGRRVGAFVQYTYVHSVVPAGLSTVFIPNLGRHSVVAGVNFYAPLFNSRRNQR
jgi:hypothetical protein